MYGVDEVQYVDEMAASLQGGGGVLHLLKGTNTDSGMEVWGWLKCGVRDEPQGGRALKGVKMDSNVAVLPAIVCMWGGGEG